MTRTTKTAWLTHPLVIVAAGVLAWIAGYAIGHHSYSVPGGFTWTAARQLQACNEAAPITGGFPVTGGCTHARELVTLSHLLVPVGVILVVIGIIIAVRRPRTDGTPA